jgi:hypothetical protein
VFLLNVSVLKFILFAESEGTIVVLLLAVFDELTGAAPPLPPRPSAPDSIPTPLHAIALVMIKAAIGKIVLLFFITRFSYHVKTIVPKEYGK